MDKSRYDILDIYMRALLKSSFQGIVLMNCVGEPQVGQKRDRDAYRKAAHRFVVDLMKWVHQDEMDHQAQLLVSWLGLASDYTYVRALTEPSPT
jgi:phosphopentomutase